MELITEKMAEVLQSKSELWIIELTDLGTHQAFMGYLLTGNYLMLGITSPKLESQISINSIPENENQEIIIPINLEDCDTSPIGFISFKGVEKIAEKWDVIFTDCRFDESVKVESSNPITIKKLVKNTRGEHLRLIGYTKNRLDRNCFFQLRLKPKLV